ncbi:MAG: DUF885 family protein [Ignavibacterium sp.]|nr:MAG: DUF885 family protein [Ignavibacterium sp.]
MKNLLIYTLLMNAILNVPICFGGDNTPLMIKIGNEYIERWTQFYPSQALYEGMIQSVYNYEDFSETSIQMWLSFNKKMLDKINKYESDFTTEDRIDGRLLRTQIETEIDKWEREMPHKFSLSIYSDLISNATTEVLVSENLTIDEKYRLLLQRLGAIENLCASAIINLKDSRPKSVEKSLNSLEASILYYKEDLPIITESWVSPDNREKFITQCNETATKIKSLIKHVQSVLVPNLSLTEELILGKEEYARKLKLYTESNMTLDQLEENALQEIKIVRGLIAELSKDYLKETYRDLEIPTDFNLLVEKPMDDMRKNHPSSEREYLELLREFSEEAENFVRDNKIATVPESNTLSLELAPESMGPAARIGDMDPAPYFHPNPWTTWYLATIPDHFPENEREDFWRSFNNHFKKFIVLHELFPGHYLQLKIARENPHTIRLLFPYGPFTEGWATLCERVVIEAGWDKNNKLTLLAQLLKRLENANRAYMSVQVHCNNWTKKKMLEFSINTCLLAPQFAKSLWGRLMRSPMQMTSYFVGYHQLSEIYEEEKERLGDRFIILNFMDTILRTGAIPVDEFRDIFIKKYP